MKLAFKTLLLCSLFSTTTCFAQAQMSLSAADKDTVNQSLDQQYPDFASLEHRQIGDDVWVKFSDNDRQQGVKLTVPNGSQLSYGDIIALAGDLFGRAKQPISDCSEQSREDCFYQSYSRLAVRGRPDDTNCDSPFVQVPQYMSMFADVRTKVEQGQKNHVPEWDVYAEIQGDINQQSNKIGCGGSFITGYFPFGEYIKLAQNNVDHFAPQALKAYRAGHSSALKTALAAHQARQNNDTVKAQKLLEYAYSKNAFASHFLTDALSSGHMRVPRKLIRDSVHMMPILQLLMLNYMHDEDARSGLNVTNKAGNAWRAYGDSHYFQKENYVHRYMINKITQASADEVYDVYQTGTLPAHSKVDDLLPEYEKINALNSDHSPLFKEKNGVVWLRKQINDAHEYHWTKFWVGYFTFLELFTSYDTAKVDASYQT